MKSGRSKHVDQFRHHACLERALMKKDHIGYVAAIKLVRKCARKVDRSPRGGKIHSLKFGNRPFVVIGPTAGVRFCPLPVTKVHRHVRDLVAAACEDRACSIPLRGIFALVEERIAQPSPIGWAGETSKDRLIARNLLFELRYGEGA